VRYLGQMQTSMSRYRISESTHILLSEEADMAATEKSMATRLETLGKQQASYAPLVSEPDDRTEMIGHRTRAALERDKLLALRAIKELEFDRAMGRLSDEDFAEMAGRLRARAARLIRQLDAGGAYREQIERDLAKKLDTLKDAKVTKDTKGATAQRVCAACSTSNDADAKFCKSCGARL